VPPARDAGKANASGGGRSSSSGVVSRAATIPGISEMFAYHATTMANTIRTSLLVFTRKARALLLCMRRTGPDPIHRQATQHLKWDLPAP
jgi:hypothetical protein